MANNDVAVLKTTVPALQMNETELMSVLKNSLYPGAKDESIKLVIGYCRASGLDPMQKPVHIVPMSVSTGRKDDQGWDIKEMRDVVMPGIGLYRTQAARSGEYAGVTEPEFGEDVNEKVGDVPMVYPKWCKVTVKRLMSNGVIVEFTAKELWRENYATKSAKSADPNAMWKRRPYAQLAKCAEAQALRKAFPEFGAQPTADEMEGKAIDDDFQGTTIDGNTGEISMPKSKKTDAGAREADSKPSGGKAQQQEQQKASGPLSAGQIAWLRKRLADAEVAEESVCQRFKIEKLEDISAADWDTQKADLLAMG